MARFELWTPSQFLARLDDVMAVYGAAFAREREVAAQREISARHATYPDFACSVALVDGRLAGFCYGPAGEPGRWWHDHVARAFERDGADKWLRDYFGVAELAVRPEPHGGGIGRELMRRLVAAAPAVAHERVLVMTNMANARAARLYRTLGFDDVLMDFRFAPGGTPKRVMALRRRRRR